MRQTPFVQWSQGSSIVHGLDPRLKLLLLGAFVISIALLGVPSAAQIGLALLYLAGTAALAKLPLFRMLKLSLLALPFIGLFAIVLYATGEPVRAYSIIVRSYLSGLSVLITIATTPLPKLLGAARFFRVPAMLVEVTQLIYRYLFVLADQAQRMQTAFAARCGQPDRRAMRASAGMVGVLFSRSYERAFMLHQAMLARSFSGAVQQTRFKPVTGRDMLAAAAGIAAAILPHLT